jgi:amino acid adenylation domain-containing protein/FkbM family methyltransferase
LSRRQNRDHIPIGVPIQNTALYILDRYDRLQPIGISGELCIAGAGLARGYLNQPELTAEKFTSPPHHLVPSSPLYKTGDLARWLPDGNVEFLGRMDHQVKIRGYRIELGEIENRLANYHEIKDVVVVDREDNRGDRYLCAYIVSSPGSADGKTSAITAALREYLSRELPAYMIPSYFVQMEELPLNTSGKVNRNALPEPGPAAPGEEYEPPGDDVEETLVELFRDVLVVDKIGRNADFFRLGGHSLKATILVSRICKAFNVDFLLNTLFKAPTVKGIAAYLKKSRKHLYTDIAIVEKKEYYPLSSAQKRLFFLAQFEHIGTTYNMPFVLKIAGKIDKGRFERAFNQLIRRHETLRTSFEFIGNQPVQRVHDTDTDKDKNDFKILEVEIANGEIDPIIDDFVRPFDLAKAPLLRVVLGRLSENDHVLLFDMHHIISDGTSTGRLIDEFTRLYNGETLQPLNVQYRDFSAWQNNLLRTGKIKKQEEYWRTLYSDDIPKLDLPADFPRPTTFTFAGDRFAFKMSSEDKARLRGISTQRGVTLFMNLMAAFYILLYKYTGEEDIIVGTATAGRSHPDLHNNIGMFVNMLALRNHPAGEKTYSEFLEQVKETSIKAFENQDLQFEAFVDDLNVTRDASRNPIFDVCLVIQNFERKEIQLQGLTFSPYEYVDKISQFDMALDVWELGDEVVCYLEYYTALFKRKTIERFSRHFLNIIGQIGKNPDVLIADIDIVSREEKHRLVYDFNNTGVDYPIHKTIHELFEEQVEKTPDGIALVGIRPGQQTVQISYRHLNEKSNQLAYYLYSQKHIRPDDIVGILMDRSVYCVIAIMGILKAGSAYVPIDPLLPEERIKGILKDARIGIIISQKRYLRTLNRLAWEYEKFHTHLCMDSWDIYKEEEVEASELLNLKKLWNYIGETAVDDITGGGWLTSYTGEPFTQKEMDEYGDNVLNKLTPLLHKKMRVLEIGCASGITMFRIAPKVGLYYGTDLSKAIIKRNKKRVSEDGLKNITLAALPAHEIDNVDEKNFDLVIINSVIQDFYGFNYLRNVIDKAIVLMAEKGHIFFGDVMDQDLKDDLIREMFEFKKANKDKKYKTKTDFSGDLFVSRKFFEDLSIDIPAIRGAQFSRKIHTIENELTKFRYDALLEVNKSIKKSAVVKKEKSKYQDDLRALSKCGTGKVNAGVHEDNLAYIMYTSGSTGKPKGVMVEHRNVVNLIHWFAGAYKMQAGTHLLQLTDYSFDPSVEDIFASLYSGATLYVGARSLGIDKDKFCRYVNRHQIHIIDFVPSALNQLLDHEEKLESLQVVISGGENLEDPVKDRIIKKGYRLYNNYGPTEITVDALSSECSEGRVHLGKPVPNTRSYVLDKDNNLAAAGVKGELCVAGAGLSRGYLNDPELTAEKFVIGQLSVGSASNMTGGITNDQSPMTNDRFYRTGDIVRWLPDGNIEFFGRKDYQVKIRGYRIEPAEIEEKIMAVDFIRDAVVIDRDNGTGENYLCSYFVSGEQVDAADLKSVLARDLPAYMIPLYFKELHEIPRKTTGKVDTKKLPEPELAGEKTAASPADPLEKKLIAAWSEVLGISKEQIGVTDNFFELGGHSLKATVLISTIHKELDIKVPLAEIFKTPTVKGLSQYIKQAGAADIYTSIEAVEKKEYYALSSAQKRLYVLQQVDKDNTGYNELSVLELEGKLDRNRFEETFRELIKRQESLRTSFTMVEEELVQRIHQENGVFRITDCEQIPDYKLKSTNIASIINDFVRPFDLGEAPLLRVGLLKLEEHRHILLVDIHHIVTDGMSQAIIIKEFLSLYKGEHLAELRVQYKDFSQWQNREKHTGLIKKQKEYWLDQFVDEIPVLNLPLDFVRPPIQVFEGSSVDFILDSQETEALKKWVRQEEATLFMVLLAIYNVFLAKINGQQDIVIGTPVSGRRHPDLQQIIGMFVNTLALRNYPDGNKTFNEFLKQLRERTLQAFENQDYQFEDLVEQAVVDRDASRNPLFDTMFALQNIEMPQVEIPGLKLKQFEYEHSTAKFDLTVQVVELKENIRFTFEFCARLFKVETVERFTRYFKRIISRVLEKADGKIMEIDILSEEEKEQLLYDFNDTEAQYPQDRTIEQLFADQAANRPDNIALVFEDMQLTYKELDGKTNNLAGTLREKRVGPGGIAAVVVERSIEMIIGIFGTLKAGAGYLPIDPGYPPERIKYILEDSCVGLLLSRQTVEGTADNAWDTLDLKDSSLYGRHPGNLRKSHTASDLAYVIYTSGSTGKPKGVMVEHRSVINILSALFKRYPFSQRDTYMLKTSCTFDVSVTELFGWFSGGGRLVLLPGGGEKDAHMILDTIAERNVTHINFVPSMFNVFVNLLNRQNTTRLDGLKYIFLAGEALGKDVVERFNRLNTAVRLENIYGPTEATIYASGYSLQDWNGCDAIPIGKPLENLQLYILYAHGRLQPVGIPGELCIAGAGIARGYLNKPRLTAEKFTASPFTLHPSPLYKTGDLARWLPDGNIEFLGRKDRQVKIRGNRVEPGEIESRLLKNNQVKEAVVIDRQEESGDRYLCAYIVADSELETSALREYLSLELPDYMIPAHYVPLAEIPLTPGGKIDRAALHVPQVKAGGEYIAPRTEIERALAEIWAGILGIEAGEIGIDTNFFHLGGHSLKAAVMSGRIHKTLHAAVSLGEIFKTPTIRGLAEYIKGAVKNRYASIEAAEKKEYYSLSSAQGRLYILQQMDDEGTGYNLPFVSVLEGRVDRNVFEDIFKRLLQKHESLRTSFDMIAGKPVQRIHDEVEFDLVYYDLARGSAGDTGDSQTNHPVSVIQHFIRPFDLSKAPLLRVGLLKEGEQKYILVVDMHHIIADGTSMGILVNDFMALYSGKDLPAPGIQYKDFAEWQNARKQSGWLEEQRNYWLNEFREEIPVLNLPLDYVRPAVQSFAGGTLNFELGKEYTWALKTYALEEGTTLFMVLLSIYTIFLAKLSQQEEIVVGTPIVGRRHADLEEIIGMFVNTLALRNFPGGAKTFGQFLREVKERALNAFENQDYPFEDLVEQVDVNRDAGRNPLFDTMFALQNMEIFGLEIPGLKLKHYDYENSIAKFDLTVLVLELKENIYFAFEFCTKLFKVETIERFTRYFKQIISCVLEKADKKILEIDILSEEEKNQILYEFNDTRTEYPNRKTIHELFAEQAEKVPDRIAAVCPMQVNVTYRELNDKATRLAARLKRKGVCGDSIVGILTERSVEMIIGILGILKAAGSYLPIDTGYPLKRIRYILKDSRLKLVLAPGLLGNRIENIPGVDVLDLLDLNVYSTEGESSAQVFSPAHLAYVIYTSGSTGTPKGVMIEHHSVINRLNWMQRFYPLCGTDVILQKTPIFFDVSVWELFWWAITGTCVCFLEPGAEKEPEKIVEAIEKNRVTTMHFVPSMLNVFLEYVEVAVDLKKLASLRQVFASGEALGLHQVETFNRLLNKGNGTKLINLYGPTEATVDVSYFNCTPCKRSDTIPIGKPIDNIQLYVVDKNRRLQPVGIAGELCIAGVGLARGYLNRPELTEEKFNRDFWDYQDYQEKLQIVNSSISNQLSSLVNHHSSFGVRLYRTGDLAKWLPDGNVEFLGRMDHQVKIRGFRIELGEIESTLRDFPAVEESVVNFKEVDAGDSALVAYVVPGLKDAFTIRRLLEMKENGRLKDSTYYEWPNGMTVFYLNRNETDFMYREIFEQKSYLKHGVTLNNGACVFDIGANIGVFSLFVNQVCRESEIYAFEPVTPVFEVLKCNTSLYGSNFKVFNYGISAKEEETSFTYYPHATILSGSFADKGEEMEAVKAFMKHQKMFHREKEILSDGELDELLLTRLTTANVKCKMKTLSQVIKENRIEKIDLLKIDVEKGEIDVLRGIGEDDWRKIHQVVMEVHDIDGRLEWIRHYLEGYGFRVTIDQDGELSNTNLYNLYAILGKQDKEHSIARDMKDRQKNIGSLWCSPNRLISALRDHLSVHLPDYMLPAYFVLLDKIPLTPNGKVNRKALPDPEKASGENYEPPTEESEQRLIKIWSEVLAIEEEKIGIDDNFFNLGGHSLKMIILAAKIHQTLGLKPTLAEFFKNPTVKGMAAVLEGARESRFIDLEQGEEKEFYELSYNQRRLWITHQFVPESAAYNMPERFELAHNVEDRLLEKAIRKIVQRHESFRTGFKQVNNNPVQFVAAHVDIPLKKVDISSSPVHERQQRVEHIYFQEARTPFDLEAVPLFRTILIKLDIQHFVMIFNMHHIISDGWSVELLKKEFMYLYDGYRHGETRELEQLKWQYKDFAQWQNKKLRNPQLKKQSHEYWKQTLAKEIPAVNLPFDFDSPGGLNSGEGAAYSLNLPLEMRIRLNQLAKDNSTSLFVVLLSLFNGLLRLISGQEDIRVGLPVWGRDHAALQNIVGFFVNTVILDSHLEEETPFIEFLHNTHDNMMEILHHQSYPLELVLADLNLKFPGVNVFFNMLNLGSDTMEEEMDASAPEHHENVNDVKFDLMLYTAEYKNGIQVNCHYNKALFRADTAAAVMEKYSKLIAFFSEYPGKSMRHFKLAQRQGKKRSLKRN